MPNKPNAVGTAFAKEVHEGLTAYPKYLSSKYFYDVIGDKLFQDIMAMPEYYLTDREYKILQTHKLEIANLFANGTTGFQLFELGAGDGKKTKVLLSHFLAEGLKFTYRPIDISQNALDQLEGSIRAELPGLDIQPIQGTYFDTLKNIQAEASTKKVILFLGSNIGNLLHPQAIDFLIQLREAMDDGDMVFMGFDQKKNPQTILDAYNDPTGITAAFNKNILTRINNELGGDFNLDKFLHWEVYDPESGTSKSYLVSKEAQQVSIDELNLQVEFKAWETIHTEISQKYDDQVVAWLAEQSGLEIINRFADADQHYKNYIFRKK